MLTASEETISSARPQELNQKLRNSLDESITHSCFNWDTRTHFLIANMEERQAGAVLGSHCADKDDLQDKEYSYWPRWRHTGGSEDEEV